VAARRWSELIGSAVAGVWRDLRGLGGNERIAVIGAGLMVGSLFLPWYQSPISDQLVQTGFGAFGWAEAALVLTAAATTFLALQGGGGYVPPRPLREWALFVAAGAWAALIVLYRIADPPQFTLEGHDEPYDLNYAIFVALAGAGIIVAAGLRMRPSERRKRPRAPD
jgi:MFS family permease